MKKKKLAGIELPSKMHFIKVEGIEKLFKDQKKENEKNCYDWIIEFFGDKKIFDIYESKLLEFLHKSLPKGIGENCKFCKNDKNEKAERNCQNHIYQAYLTFILAANEFVNIVHSNQFIYEDKKVLFELTKQFYTCFHFIKGKGTMYYDLDLMVRYCVDAGLEAVAEIFRNSEPLQNIEWSNETLDFLNKEHRKDELFEREDLSFTSLQIKFFKDKMQYYEKKYLIEMSKAEKETTKNASRPNRTDIAYYCYYTSETKTLKIENIFPSDKAWQEIGKRYNKNSKNIQKMYNEIVHDYNERTKKSRIKNLKYVIDSMLTNNEKASFLARKELNDAKLNS